jgi:ubiquinone/menaquinone biosynthesis C-methylase UbiE
MPRPVTHELSIPCGRDESARQDFVSSMRAYVLSDTAGFMRTVYEKKARPSFASEQGRDPRDGPEIHRLMKRESMFKFYSRLRADTQGMVWRSVLPGISAHSRELAARSAELGARHDVGGTLALDPDLAVPDNVTALDVHFMPGCYHSEYFAGDVTAGALYDQGLSVFFMGFLGDDHDDVGRSVAEFLKRRYPDFAPRKMLDVGCTVGGDTLPWGESYPELEIHAIDPCAPLLRYAHGRAQSLGQPVHFHQMNGTSLSFPDDSFDLVWSAQVLHELPPKMLRRCLKECHRVLKPGGLMIHMELPPNHQVPPYEQFYIDWDAYYNNEPWYKAFRDMDPVRVVTDAGFAADSYVQFAIPSLLTNGQDALEAAAAAQSEQLEGNVGKLEAGVQWFTFGAWK